MTWEFSHGGRPMGGSAVYRSKSWCGLRLACLLVLGLLPAVSQRAEFFSIGPDASFVPRGFTSITETAQ